MAFLKSFWYNYIQKSKPWVDIAFDGKQMTVNGYNQAFIEEQRKKNGDLSDGRTDDEVAKLFVDKENLEREDPLLVLKHHGVEPDGRVKVEIEWNRAFIQHLNDLGIFGEHDGDMINLYLDMVTHKSDVEREVNPNEDGMRSAFAELDAETDREYRDAEKQAMKPRRRTYR